MKFWLTAVLLLPLALARTAFATTIDFESQGAAAPGAFNGKLNSPLSIGIATFTGGELLRNVSGAADTSAVYGTTNFVAGAYADPLMIHFLQSVTSFSLQFTNAIPDTYTLATDAGGTASYTIDANTTVTGSVGGAAFQNVTVGSSQQFEWDFAIDNVTFSIAGVAVPEPALPLTAGLLAGALAFAALNRRIRAFARG